MARREIQRAGSSRILKIIPIKPRNPQILMLHPDAVIDHQRREHRPIDEQYPRRSDCEYPARFKARHALFDRHLRDVVTWPSTLLKNRPAPMAHGRLDDWTIG